MKKSEYLPDVYEPIDGSYPIAIDELDKDEIVNILMGVASQLGVTHPVFRLQDDSSLQIELQNAYDQYISVELDTPWTPSAVRKALKDYKDEKDRIRKGWSERQNPKHPPAESPWTYETLVERIQQKYPTHTVPSKNTPSYYKLKWTWFSKEEFPQGVAAGVPITVSGNAAKATRNDIKTRFTVYSLDRDADLNMWHPTWEM
jgi:hypothetical protein